MTSDNDTNEGGEVIQLFAPRDPGTRRMLWNMLKAHPKRATVIASLRRNGKVLRFNRQPPSSDAS